MQLKNILISINVRWWNAEAAYAVNLALAFIKTGHKVILIVNDQSPVHQKALDLQIPVVLNLKLDSYSPITQWKNYHHLIQLIDREHIQIINSFKSNGSLIFSRARKKRPGLLYIKTRGEARAPKANFLNRRAYSQASCDGIITVGTRVKDWITALRLKNQPVEIIPFACETLSLSPRVDQAALRDKLNINPNAQVASLIGRLQRVKGHQLLIEALNRLKENPLQLLMPVKDLNEFPNELKEIKMLIKKYALEKKVSVIGFQERLGDIISLLDFGIVPSLASEVNCRVTVELFSLGVPVLAFPVGSLPDIIDHKVNGFLCSGIGVNDLVEGIKWMSADPARLKNMGEQALISYRKYYNLKTLGEKTLEFYQRCGKNKKGFPLNA
ncbi:MAG: glycosyltransferase family 4 protein [Deltaproteobacteria bacterium]|nr:glycosyltransferase family 4 protein [Deltaproteobacteria bacterium]